MEKNEDSIIKGIINNTDKAILLQQELSTYEILYKNNVIDLPKELQ